MDNGRLYLEAIARRRCIEAIYSRGRVLLAPHILYTRHDDLFVDAATLERDGRPPRETKLGTFKVSGLGAPQVTDVAFEPHPSFGERATRYYQTLFAVEQTTS